MKRPDSVKDAGKAVSTQRIFCATPTCTRLVWSEQQEYCDECQERPVTFCGVPGCAEHRPDEIGPREGRR